LNSCEAIDAIEQALIALDHLPQSRETLELGIDLWLSIRQAAVDPTRMRDAVREAERLSVTLGDRRQLARVSSSYAATARYLGDLDGALQAARRAVAAADSLDDPLLQLTTRVVLAGIHHDRGEFRLATDNLDRGVSLLPADVLQEGVSFASPAVVARYRLAMSLCEIGDFHEANAHLADAVRIAETHNDTGSLIMAAACLGGAALGGGYPEKTIFWLERGLKLLDGKDTNVSHWVAAGLGMAYALVGRISEGLALLEQALDASRAMQISR
jgi:tetratricopeptide (TPR) repeat protein